MVKIPTYTTPFVFPSHFSFIIVNQGISEKNPSFKPTHKDLSYKKTTIRSFWNVLKDPFFSETGALQPASLLPAHLS